MVAVGGAIDDLRQQLQEAIAQPGLAPMDRMVKLRSLRDGLTDLIGEAETYISDVELIRESEYLDTAESVRVVRENATLREALIERGIATGEELDQLGFVSHEELDRLREEGRLLEVVGMLHKWTEKLHPRERGTGKFADKPGAMRVVGRTGATLARLGAQPQPNPHERRDRAKQRTAEIGSEGGAGKRVERAAAEQRKEKPKPLDVEVTLTRPQHHTKQKPWKPVLDKINVPDLFGADAIDWKTSPGRKTGGTVKEPTFEEIMADLETARSIGLNDWPDKDELAEEILGDAFDTQALYKTVPTGDTGPDGKPVMAYTDERKALHDQIIDVLLRKRKLDKHGRPTILDTEGEELVPHGEQPKPRVLFMGGGTASGKTTALELDENKEVAPPDAALIDPDEIKAMLPEYADLIEGGSRYAATAAHEESSDLAKRLQKEAIARGLNVLVDGTSDSPIAPDDPSSLTKVKAKLDQFRNAGYDVSMFYVSAPADLAVVRAVSRAQRTGRWVPEKEIRAIHKGVSQRWQAEVMPLIEEGYFSDVRGYDTTLTEPQRMFRLDDSGRLVISNADVYEAFKRKASGEGGTEDLRQLFV